MRTPAPNARGGRLEVNFDLTTPEFPCGRVTRLSWNELNNRGGGVRDNAPPDDANLGALDFPLGFVDVCHTLGGDGSGRVRWG